LNDGLLKYVDTKKVPFLVSEHFGLQLPTSSETKNSTSKILTEVYLKIYREEQKPKRGIQLEPNFDARLKQTIKLMSK